MSALRTSSHSGDGLHRCRHRRGARQSSGSLATASRKLRQAIPHRGCLAAPYTARIDVALLYGPDSPGALILTLFWDKIDSGEIAGHYQNLVAAIKSRGEKAGKVPKIVFTTYPQPLPSAGQSDDCFEVGDLARDELDYLSTFENTLKATLRARRAGSPACLSPRCPASCRGTSTARAIRGRTGSVLLHNDDSLAPFHPTPNGQAAIVAVVKGSLQPR